MTYGQRLNEFHWLCVHNTVEQLAAFTVLLRGLPMLDQIQFDYLCIMHRTVLRCFEPTPRSYFDKPVSEDFHPAGPGHIWSPAMSAESRRIAAVFNAALLELARRGIHLTIESLRTVPL